MAMPPTVLSDLFAAEARPVLWVGPGLSFAPPERLQTHLAGFLPTPPADAEEAVRHFIDRLGLGALTQQLQTLSDQSRTGSLHRALMRLAGRGVFRAVITTNPDRLLEDAAKAEGVAHHVVAFADNLHLAGRDEVSLFKIHGDMGNWAGHLAVAQGHVPPADRALRALDLLLSQHPVLYLGTPPTDPRLLALLTGLPPAERGLRLPGRMVVGDAELARLPSGTRALLAEANIRPIQVDDLEALFVPWAEAVDPPEVAELVFSLKPSEESFTLEGPGGSHVEPNPLKDQIFRDDLAAFQKVVAQVVAEDHPDTPTQTAAMRALATRLGRRLTAAFGPLVEKVQNAIATADSDPPRLTLMVPPGPGADEALALPWELLRINDRFPVEDAHLDLVRVAGPLGPELGEPVAALGIAVCVAAPDGVSPLNYEEESYRLVQALHGHAVAFADLGTREDLVQAAAAGLTSVVHFSGHGLPGRLVFEDAYGLPHRVEIADLVADLRAGLPGGRPFPRVFFLANCHGASATLSGVAPEGSRDGREIAAALGEGPSTAATLHRSGFAHVVAYFGPVGDRLCTRAEEVYYQALAEGCSLLQAARRARHTLGKPLEREGRRYRYPLAFAQLVLYHRGPDGPLVRAGKRAAPARPLYRQMLQVNGLPVLAHGFIGRRSMLHELRRKFRDGQRLFVLQGLGGLGKTALASAVTGLFSKQTPLILALAEASGVARAADAAMQHGLLLGISGWEATAKAINERHEKALDRFVVLVKALRRHTPDLVVYADNAESLQNAPRPGSSEAVEELGAWRDEEAAAWWAALEEMSREGAIVLLSTRYGWKGLSPRNWVRVPRMSPADLLRMAATFEHLGRLPIGVQVRIAEHADGRPRTLERFDGLLAPLDWEGMDVWKGVVAPLLKNGRLVDDLLLDALWASLSSEAQAHAGRLTVLETPAPRMVVEALGGEADVLLRASLLTRQPALRGVWEQRQWEDRYALHAEVRRFIGKHGGVLQREAQAQAGQAWVKYLEGFEIVYKDDNRQAIRLLHISGNGDAAWARVQPHVIWMRDVANYAEALEVIEESLAANTTGDRRAMALIFWAQTKSALGLATTVEYALSQAMTLAETEVSKALVLCELGRSHKQSGHYMKAENFLRDALTLLERSVGVEHQEFGAALHELGWVLSLQDKNAEAAVCLRKALLVAEKRWGLDHPTHGASLHELARVLERLGRDDEAQDLAQKAMVIFEKAYGADHPRVSSSLHVLARLSGRRGEFEKSESLFRRAMAISASTLGVDHPSYSESLHELAMIVNQQGRHQEAEVLLRQSLSIDEKALGADHHSYAISLGSLSMVIAQQGRSRWMDALPLATQAVDICIRSLGMAHRDTGQLLSNLGQIQALLGKPVAQQTLAQAVKALGAALGAEHEATRAARYLAHMLATSEKRKP